MKSPSSDELLVRVRDDLAARYVVERQLRSGGMATVFLALDRRYERRVAIKVLRPELADAVGTRFLQEIEFAARLNHPHILPLLDSGEAGGSLFYVMPFVPEESLQEWLAREKQLAVRDAVRIAREVADALAYAHASGIVHRDIKPGNILLSNGHAVVADFGIARAVSAVGVQAISSAGLAIGTPAYMSPEQAAGGLAVVDGRSDIYSLGCVLYEMLAGTPPFSGPTPQALVARHMVDPVPPLSTIRSIPEHVELAITRALAKIPGDRFATAAAFKAALGRPRESGSRAAVLSARSRRRWRAGAVLVAAGLALVAAFAFWRLRPHPVPALDPSRVVVYPLTVGGNAARGALSGEDVSTALVAALNSTQVLKGINALRLVGGGRTTPASSPDPGDLAIRSKAGFYVDGRILAGDSTRAVVELHDVKGDSTLHRIVTLPSSDDAWGLGVAVARDLLPVLLGRGTPIDLRALGSPSSTATAAYLVGDRAYRRGHFEEASTDFARAVESDSTFAMAAVMGAQAAGWARQKNKAVELLRVALDHRTALAPRYTSYLLGLSASWLGEADTAIRHLRTSLNHDRDSPETWAELGEVYSHWLPSEPAADSLQEDSFQRAYRLDPGFVPALYHLVEISLRRGDVAEAGRLIGTMRTAGADSIDLAALVLMLQCVEESPERIDWDREAQRPADVVDVGSALAVTGLRQPHCSEAAWRAVLRHDPGADPSELGVRYRALVGLHGLLIAEQRYEEAQRLLNAERALPRERIWPLQIVATVAGAPESPAVRFAAESLARVARSPGRAAVAAWCLGLWEHRLGHARAVRLLAQRAATDARRSGATRLDTLVSQSLQGWAALTSGDSAEALRLFQVVRPLGGEEHWEALGAERMKVAELQMSRGQYLLAFRAASLFDAPGGIAYLAYLRPSLIVRQHAARAMGDQKVAASITQRLAELESLRP